MLARRRTANDDHLGLRGNDNPDGLLGIGFLGGEKSSTALVAWRHIFPQDLVISGDALSPPSTLVGASLVGAEFAHCSRYGVVVSTRPNHVASSSHAGVLGCHHVLPTVADVASELSGWHDQCVCDSFHYNVGSLLGQRTGAEHHARCHCLDHSPFWIVAMCHRCGYLQICKELQETVPVLPMPP